MQDHAIADFVFSRLPEIHFGAGKMAQLPRLIRQTGKRVLLVTGSASFRNSLHHEQLVKALSEAAIEFFQVQVAGEPSPSFVDQTVARFRHERLDLVVGIGGGSAMDAGKAISAMLLQEDSVTTFMEGTGSKPHDGRKLPYIAVPTSSGTGAEATKNAVLSSVGGEGYKYSLRHDNFVPDMALIDPELMLGCPPPITAACGLDALTQLLEAYVSTQSSPMTDALALSGLTHIAAGFLAAYENGDVDIEARSHLAYAALLSGITLANAGLGVVHGFAAPIGGYFPMPHGEVCGTLLGEATRLNIETLSTNVAKNQTALEKYAKAGALLSGAHASSVAEDCERLVQTLQKWIELTRIPRLGQYGVRQLDFPRILDKTNNQNSPATLSRDQMATILAARL